MRHYYINYGNANLEVHGKIPEGGIEVDEYGCIKDLESFIKNNVGLDRNSYYFCKECNGYIQGIPNCKSENTLGPLCGRRGQSHSCIRCGYEMSFNGIIS